MQGAVSPFDAVRIGPITIRNRFIKAAANEAMTVDGAPSRALVEHHPRAGRRRRGHDHRGLFRRPHRKGARSRTRSGCGPRFLADLRGAHRCGPRRRCRDRRATHPWRQFCHRVAAGASRHQRVGRRQQAGPARRQLLPAGDERCRYGTRRGAVHRGRAAVPGGGLRWRRSAHGAWLPAEPVHFATVEQAARCIWRRCRGAMRFPLMVFAASRRAWAATWR